MLAPWTLLSGFSEMILSPDWVTVAVAWFHTCLFPCLQSPVPARYCYLVSQVVPCIFFHSSLILCVCCTWGTLQKCLLALKSKSSQNFNVIDMDGLVQERCNSSTLAIWHLEVRYFLWNFKGNLSNFMHTIFNHTLKDIYFMQKWKFKSS